MGNETDNSGQVTNNDNNQQQQSNQVDDRGGVVDGVDPSISKHLDMAIEAQDGKVDANAKKEGSDANAGKEKQSTDSQSSTGDNTTQSSEKKPDAEISEAARKLAGAKDLKLADGSVVKGGAERRFYEQREAARQELGNVKGDLNRISQEYRALQEKYTTLDSATKNLHGADAQTLSIGAKIVSDMQRDPVGTVKKLVAEVAAQGYNVQDLGVGVDTAAIKRLIEERLPLNQTTEKSEADLVQEVQGQVGQFYSQFPDAKPHDALLAAVLRDHPELDLKSAYFAIKSSFADKGYDFSLSLEDNLKATASGSQDNGASQQQTNQKPLPSGGNAGNGEFKLNDKAAADDSMDTGDIVKQAMRESGLNI